MFNRRRFLERTLRGSALIAAGPMVLGFLADSARAAKAGDETILVVVELTGGNDGLNTVAPYADDLYHKARPSLALKPSQVVRVDDHIGLNPGLRGLEPLLKAGRLAIVQGVGYPNPDRSHFESMDVWQMADPSREAGSGWLGRSLGSLRVAPGRIPAAYVGPEALPLAMRGASASVPTIHPSRPFDLELGLGGQPRYEIARFTGRPPRTTFPIQPANDPPAVAARRSLIEALADLSPSDDPMRQFVRRNALETYATIGQVREIARDAGKAGAGRGTGRSINNTNGGALGQELSLVADLIAAEFGTRIFYLSTSGFDTHANQSQSHQQVLQQVGDAIASFFSRLDSTGHAGRVLLMTFSEFGRRVAENGSRGTDHGAGSNLFLAGPAVSGGVIGPHPSLEPDQLDSGDLRHHTDFRQVYATLLDDWLGCDSRSVLGGTFKPLPLLGSGTAGKRSRA